MVCLSMFIMFRVVIKRETKDDYWSKENTEFEAVLAYERSNVFSKS